MNIYVYISGCNMSTKPGYIINEVLDRYDTKECPFHKLISCDRNYSDIHNAMIYDGYVYDMLINTCDDVLWIEIVGRYNFGQNPGSDIGTIPVLDRIKSSIGADNVEIVYNKRTNKKQRHVVKMYIYFRLGDKLMMVIQLVEQAIRHIDFTKYYIY